MSKAIALTTCAVMIACSMTSAVALPPRTGAEMSPALESALENCGTQCSGKASRRNCAAMCSRIWHNVHTSTPSGGGGPIDRTNCDITKAAMWAWYTFCAADLAVMGDAVTSALGGILGAGESAIGLINAGRAAVPADPCGYVRDQVIAQTPSCH